MMPHRQSASLETTAGGFTRHHQAYLYNILFISNELIPKRLLFVYPVRQNFTVASDIYIESQDGGVFIAARVDKGGEEVRQAMGVFYWVFANGTYKVTNDICEFTFQYRTCSYGS